jgi:hypothetical protein
MPQATEQLHGPGRQPKRQSLGTEPPADRQFAGRGAGPPSPRHLPSRRWRSSRRGAAAGDAGGQRSPTEGGPPCPTALTWRVFETRTDAAGDLVPWRQEVRRRHGAPRAAPRQLRRPCRLRPRPDHRHPHRRPRATTPRQLVLEAGAIRLNAAGGRRHRHTRSTCCASTSTPAAAPRAERTLVAQNLSAQRHRHPQRRHLPHRLVFRRRERRRARRSARRARPADRRHALPQVRRRSRSSWCQRGRAARPSPTSTGR